MSRMLRENDECRRGELQRMRILTLRRNLSPARLALLAFLRHRKIQTAFGQLASEETRKDELVVKTLGPHIMDRYIAAKTEEWDSYRTSVDAWELNRYLTIF